MNIFIDESGSFTFDNTKRDKSCFESVAAVVMNDNCLKQWNSTYATLDKAHKLNKHQATKVSEFLRDNGGQCFIIVTDSSAYTIQDIDEHRLDFINSMYSSTSGHPYFLIESVDAHAERLKKFSGQQYVKTMLIMALIENVIRGILSNIYYYSQAEGANFHWNCDNLTEDTYPTIRYLVHLLLSGRSSQNPMNVDNKEYILAFLDGSGKYVNTNKILEHFSFSSEEKCNGIKSADCVANFARGMLRSIPKRRFENDSIENIISLINHPFGFKTLHFNKDSQYVESSLSHYGQIFYNRLIKNFEC